MHPVRYGQFNSQTVTEAALIITSADVVRELSHGAKRIKTPLTDGG